MVQRQTLGLCDLLEIPWRLLLVAGPANRGQAVGIVCVIPLLAERQRGPMVEDNSSEHQARAALKTATILPEHNLGEQQSRQIASPARLKDESPPHGLNLI
jgi:hypothetical protein